MAVREGTRGMLEDTGSTGLDTRKRFPCYLAELRSANRHMCLDRLFPLNLPRLQPDVVFWRWTEGPYLISTCGLAGRFVRTREEKEKGKKGDCFNNHDGRCIRANRTGLGLFRFILFYPIDPWSQPNHCNFIKRSSTLPPHGCIPYPPPPQVLRCWRSPSSPLLPCSSPPLRLPVALERMLSPTSNRYPTSTPSCLFHGRC